MIKHFLHEPATGRPQKQLTSVDTQEVFPTGLPGKVDAPEPFSSSITLAHGRKMGKEIRAS